MLSRSAMLRGFSNSSSTAGGGAACIMIGRGYELESRTGWSMVGSRIQVLLSGHPSSFVANEGGREEA